MDIVLCPVNALPAFPVCTGIALGPSQSYTALYSVLDYTAGVVPVTQVDWTRDVGKDSSIGWTGEHGGGRTPYLPR